VRGPEAIKTRREKGEEVSRVLYYTAKIIIFFFPGVAGINFTKNSKVNKTRGDCSIICNCND
jgi:hypothetical protein